MRIRKRKVPFPLSSLSPVPLSDPHFNRSSMEQLQVLFGNSQSSDQPNHPIGDQDWSDSARWKQEEKKVLSKEEEDQKEGGREGEKSSTNDSRILGAKTPTIVFQESTSFHQVDGRWCEEEKAFPFKNRRGSFERKLLDNEEKDKKMKTKLKTKMKKKCIQRNGNQEKEDHDEESHEDHNNYNKETNKEGVDHRSSSSSSSVKKRVRGGALMEGSRCSRVNGRGWRCCQQTLVGYSLCEHHLGKGRLRSMTSVRSRSMANTAPNKGGLLQPLSNPSLPLAEEETVLKNISLDDKIVAGTIHGSKEEEMKPLMMGKKKQKLGMVKARSISSLLGQANNAIAVVLENEE